MSANYKELDLAKTLYRELLWRLAFLRPITATPKPEPTDEELLNWYANIKQREQGQIWGSLN